MKDIPILSVTKIVDDESGICSGDLCDFSIHCSDLDDFLRSHGQKGAEEICKTLDYLKKAVMEEYLPKSKKESKSKMKIKISKNQWEQMGKKAGWMARSEKEDRFLHILEFEGQKAFDNAIDKIIDPTGYVRNISPNVYEEAIKKFFGVNDFSVLNQKLRKAIEMSIMEHVDRTQGRPL